LASLAGQRCSGNLITQDSLSYTIGNPLQPTEPLPEISKKGTNMIYQKEFTGDLRGSHELNQVSAVVKAAGFEFKTQPVGVRMMVDMDKRFAPDADPDLLGKVLVALGFAPVTAVVEKKSRKPRKPTGDDGQGGALIPKKITKQIADVFGPATADFIPSGCYRHDGTQDKYYARTLQLKLAAKEFGPGVRFERNDGTWWVVVMDEKGVYGLKPATD
jgi:hypothetical protein